MKLLVLDPNFYKSALLMDNKRRAFNHCIVAQKMLSIFENQATNTFATVPNYKVWRDHKDALKLYFNCLLKVCKEIHNINTKYEYFTDINEDLEFPPFTDLTFKSHQAFCINLDYDLYYSKFSINEGFNGGILLWEYNLQKNDENITVVEDFNGVFKREKFDYDKKFIINDDYNLKEINKENLNIK